MPWQNIRHLHQCPVGNTHTENLGKGFHHRIRDIVGKAPQGKATGDKNERNEVAYSVFTDNAVFLSVVLHGSYFFGWD